MSTLTSVDMNVDRSSTRLHAPPGGKTSICLGTFGQDENIAKPVNNRQPSTNNIFGQEEDKVVKPVKQTVTNNIFGTNDTPDVVQSTRRPSVNNIFAQETEGELEKKRQASRRPSNSQGMSSIMAPNVNEAPISARNTRRQAPGGTSSFTLG